MSFSHFDWGDNTGTCEVDEVVTPRKRPSTTKKIRDFAFIKGPVQRRRAWQEASDHNIEDIIRERNVRRIDQEMEPVQTPGKRRYVAMKRKEIAKTREVINRPEATAKDAWIGAVMDKHDAHEVMRESYFPKQEIYVRNRRLHDNDRNKNASGVRFSTSKRFHNPTNIRNPIDLPPERKVSTNLFKNRTDALPLISPVTSSLS